MTEKYFLDTYAILEIISGNASYMKYEKTDAILTKLNLFELFYKILMLHGKEKAVKYTEKYSEFVIDYDIEVIDRAAILKLNNKNMSMTDCIGYILSLKYGVKFLTGDDAFRGMPNVEFLK